MAPRAEKGRSPGPSDRSRRSPGLLQIEDPPLRPPVSLPLPSSDDAALRIAPGGVVAFRVRSAHCCAARPLPDRSASLLGVLTARCSPSLLRAVQPSLRGSQSEAFTPGCSPPWNRRSARRSPCCSSRFPRSRGIFQLTGLCPDFLRSSPDLPGCAQGTHRSSTVHPHGCPQISGDPWPFARHHPAIRRRFDG